MRDIAKEVYQACAIGDTSWMQPNPNKGETIDAFQAVISAAQALEQAGAISILKMHKESQSGQRLVTAIQFTRLK